MNYRYSRDRLWFKTVSFGVAALFLFTQLIDPAFAQELKSSLSEKPFKTLKDYVASSGYSIDEFQKLESTQTSEIDWKNVVESFQIDKKTSIVENLLSKLSDKLKTYKDNIDRIIEEFKAELEALYKRGSSGTESTQATTEETSQPTQEETGQTQAEQSTSTQDAPIIEETYNNIINTVEASNTTSTQDDSSILTLTTVDGHQISYRGTEIVTIVRPDGTRIDDPIFDDMGNLLSGRITLIDGTILVIEGGLIKEETAKDGKIYLYSYEKDSSGAITKTTLTYDGTQTEFDSQGQILKLTKPDGTVTTYDNKQISSILVPNGKTYIYESDLNNLSTFTRVIDSDGSIYYYDSNYNVTSATRPDGALITNIVLDSEGYIVYADIRLTDGTLIEMRDRLIQRIELAYNLILSYTYIYDEAGNISQLNITKTEFILHDTFDNFNKTYWTIDKGTADSIDGELVLNSGASSYTIISGNESYERLPTPINVQADFKLDSIQTEFYFGLKGYGDAINGEGGSNPDQNQGNTLRFLGILQKDGELYVRYREGTGYRNVATGIKAEAGIYYTLEIEFSDTYSRAYLYERGGQAQEIPLYESLVADYDPYLYTYAKDGRAYIDNLDITKKTEYSFASPIDDPYYSYLPLSYKESYQTDLNIKTIQYDSNNNIVEVVKLDGTQIHYTNNLIDQVTQPDGTQTISTYALDEFGQVLQTNVYRGDIIRSYNEDGLRYQLQTADGTINYESDNLPESIVKEDGTILTNLRFDINTGEILDMDILFPDGNTKIYRDGLLVEAIILDGSRYTYDESGQINSYTSPDGIRINITQEFTPEGNQILTLENIAKGETRGYIDGILKQKTDYLNVTSSYDYDIEGRLIHEAQTKGSYLLHDYTYSYTDTTYIVQDETSTIRTYDSTTNELKELTYPDGTTYLYTKMTDGTTIAQLKVDEPSVGYENYVSGGSVIEPRSDALYTSQSTFTTNVIEVNAFQFNSISWNEVTPVGTDIQIQTRTGDTLVPDETWNAWSTPLQDSAGSEVASPPAKYIQYQITMSTEDPAISPKLIEDAATGFVTLDYVKSYETILDSTSSGTREFIELADSNVTLSSYKDASATLLLHSDGSDNSTSTYDSSLQNYSLTFGGDAHLDTEDKVFGASSLAFDGAGDYIRIPDSDDWNFGLGNFTIDTWVKFNSTDTWQTILGQHTPQQSGNHTGWSLQLASYGTIFFHQTYDNAWDFNHGWGFLPEPNTWYHLAVVRSGNDFTLYINGVSQGGQSYSGAMRDFGYPLEVGRQDTSTPGAYFNGNIDELRISKGAARWTDNFTPPNSEYHGLYNSQGSFMTNVDEFPSGASLVSWNEVTPVGTNISVQTRTGDTYLPDGSWSEWSSPLTDSQGSTITSPEARFIQYRINLETLDPAITPTLVPDETGSFVKLNYAQGLQDTISLTSFDITGGMKDEASSITSTISQESRPAAFIDPLNGVSTIKYINDSSNIIDYIERADGTKIYDDFPDFSLYKTLSSDTIILSKIDASGNILETLRADGKRYTYNGSEIGDIIDAQGNLIADYIYNDIGNLERVELVYSRDELASFVEYNTTMTYQERDSALSELEKAVQKAIADTERQYAQGMAQAQAERDRLNSLGSGYDISQALRDVAKYESDLATAKDKALIDIETERLAKYEEILIKTEDSLIGLSGWERNTLDEIIRQETFSLVDTYYREYLGRSATNLEMDSWQARALSGEAITGTNLSSYLEALPEHSERLAHIESIITSIKDKLNIYINGPPQDKSNLLASLGLSQDQAVPISGAEYIRIISYLYKQDLTFARGAVDSLKVLVDSKGINISYEELASHLILTDILTGSINFESKDLEPELKLSAYSMMKAASLYGLNLEGYKLTYDELLTLFSPLSDPSPLQDPYYPLSTPYPPFLAHIDSNRFIVVTEVTDASLTYIDVSQGITTELSTMTKDEFLSKWDGIVIAESTSQAATLLTEAESKTISGSSLKDLSTLAIDYLKDIISIGQTVIDRVKDFLYSFLDMSDQEKESALGSLGLSITQVVTLTKDAIDSIISWFSSQSLYIINCASEALFSLFSNIGKDVSKEDIATKAILIDILTGSLTQSTSGSLELSMYSIQKAAQLEGLDLTAAKVSFDFLNELTEPFIASLDLDLNNIPDHYVLITKITSTDITYIEQDGKTYSLSIDNFKTKFTGYILSPEETKLQDKSLSEYLLMNIRGGKKDGGGGGIWGWIGIIIAVVALPFAPAILGGIGAAFTSIAGAIPALGGIGTAISGVIGGVGTAISGIGSFLGSIGSALPFNPFQASTVLAEKGLGVAIVNTITDAAINYGVSTGMSVLGESLGIDPAITNVVSALVSQGWDVALQTAATEGIKYLGEEIGLDPVLTSVLGSAASSLIGSGLNGTWKPVYNEVGQIVDYDLLTGFDAMAYTFNNSIFPDAVGELAAYGIQELGEELGISQEILTVGSLIVRSGIAAGFGSGWDPTVIFQTVTEGLAQGALTYGIKFVSENITDDPLLQSLTSRAIAGAIEGAIFKQNIFLGIFDAAKQTVLDILGTTPTELISNIINFTTLASNVGIVDALEMYGTSIFNSGTIDSITRIGGFTEAILSPKEDIILPDGTIGKQAVLTTGTAVLYDSTGNFIGFERNGIVQLGTFGIADTGDFGLQNGSFYGILKDGSTYQGEVENGRVSSIAMDAGGNDIRVYSIIDTSSIYDETGGLFDAGIDFGQGAYNFVFNSGILDNILVSNAEASEASIVVDGQSIPLNKFLYTLANGIRNPEIDINKPPQYILNLEDDIWGHSNYTISKEKDMLAIPLYHGMFSWAGLNEFIDWAGAKGLYDGIRWLAESQTTHRTPLFDKVNTDLVEYFSEHPLEWNRPMVGVGYSGGFMPLVEASQSMMYNVKTLVGLGAPTAYLPSIISKELLKVMEAVAANDLLSAVTLLLSMSLGYPTATLEVVKDIVVTEVLKALSNLSGATFPFKPNPKTELIVNVWGTEDGFHKLGVVDKRDNFLGKTTYNIEIEGATHGDYMRREGVDENSTEPEDVKNFKIAGFVTDLIIASEDSKKLDDFIELKKGQGIMSSPDARGVYVVSSSLWST